jgi:hypothetical protein
MATGEAGPPVEPPTMPVDLGPIGPKQRYEFTPVQEAVIGDLAGKMRFVGAFMLTLAVFAAVQVLMVLGMRWKEDRPFDVFGTIQALIYGLIGFWTLDASKAFREVVTTTGWDVPHVMDALRSLRKMYSLLFWLLIASIAAVFILMVGHRLR